MLLVARIAYNILERENPKALEDATELLRVYSNKFPYYTKFEGEYPFVECATLADYIKYRGGSW